MTIRWPSRIAAFLLWVLAALSATYWLLKVIGVSEAPVTAGVISADAPVVDVQDLARALGPATTPGATAAALPQAQAQAQVQVQDAAARMRLLGVVAGRRSGGVALISVDGELPRPYRVGSLVDASYKLTRVAMRSATLTPTQADGQSFTLELPLDTPEAPKPAGPWGGPATGRPPGLAQPYPVPGLTPRPAVPLAAPAANANPPVRDTEEATKD